MSVIRCLLVSLLALSSVLHAETRWIDTQPKGGKEWTSRQTRTLKGIDVEPVAADALTRFGGLADGKRDGTGFFRVEKINDRWWLIDPDGGRFIFSGVGSVKPHDDYGSKEPFQRLFGSNERWADKTLESFRSLGFNGCGGFSDDNVLRASSKPMPYTVTLHLMSGFGRKLNLTHQASGHTGFAHDCLPVFHPDFEKYCMTQCAERLGDMKQDPWLVGVFSDNELPVAKDMLDRMLALDDSKRGFANMKAGAEAFMRGKGKINDDLRREFVEHVYETYFRITTKAIRAALPHHLCLGSRFHGPAVNNAAAWRAAGRWCDAISINYYNVWTPNKEHLDNWLKWSGKPILITEFYAKGADSGMGNTSGAGWLVKTQADRGAFYQNFTLALMESKTCVGWHWFKYMDNDPSNPNTDPSNRDSNKGMFNARYEPYTPLLDAMRELNTRVYPLIEHFDTTRR
ncbi:hypothetical protein [Aporhodopirellula aestuarii]|uniref:Agarase n=1 Tax=Aporhodopirellula aestuarii TaxID=2950107 RepID=A0ABT0UA23_9BACT|nr:hypothetical protein [Aporhodopirellula aestuarii]MCM2373626.1 hypothetical protein [Aporhodopirellula aestuarii]